MRILDRNTAGKRWSEVSDMEQDAAMRDAVLYGGTGTRAVSPQSGAGIQAATRTCAAPDCSGGWTTPWNSRRRPIFEEQWGCRGACLHTLVRTAVRREMEGGSGFNSQMAQRHVVPLGMVLLAQGWITNPQLQSALQAQREKGHGRIGDWLIQSCGLAEERVTLGLGVQWNCPVLALDGFSPSAMALVMPKRFVAEFGMIPVRVSPSRTLHVAFEERIDQPAAVGIEQMTALTVQSGLLSRSQFEIAKQCLLSAEAVPLTVAVAAGEADLCDRLTDILEGKQPIAARLVRVNEYFWMRIWLESGGETRLGRLAAGIENVQDHLLMVTDSAAAEDFSRKGPGGPFLKVA